MRLRREGREEQAMRKLLIGVLAGALVMAGVLVALVGPWPCRVTQRNCDRIREGMTQAEVHAILGGPPGDYRTRPPAERFLWQRRGEGIAHLTEKWEGDEGTI